MILQQELYRLIILDRIVTVEEMADVADCSPNTMYAYAEGRRDVPHRRVKRLRRYLKGRDHCPDLAECLLEPGEKIVSADSGETNGNVDDEIGPAVEALGDARKHFREGNEALFYDAIRRVLREVDTLKAEGMTMYKVA